MGNIDHTPHLAAQHHGGTADNPATILARVGDRLRAQRVELYSFDGTVANVVERWVALGMPVALGENSSVPLTWFPWSLGTIRPNEYLFVRNAAVLPMTEPPLLIGADLGIGAAVMVPLIVAGDMIGALCVYWREERQSWDSSSRDDVTSWALTGLLNRR